MDRKPKRSDEAVPGHQSLVVTGSCAELASVRRQSRETIPLYTASAKHVLISSFAAFLGLVFARTFFRAFPVLYL